MSRELWGHQKEAVEKYAEREYFGLIFDMGLGKTLTATRIAEKKDMPCIIIAPNAVCEQWAEELLDKSKDRITEKDWDVFLCTTKEKNKKGYLEKLNVFLQEDEK